MYEVGCMIIAERKWHEQEIVYGIWLSFIGTNFLRQLLSSSGCCHRITPFPHDDVASKGSGASIQEDYGPVV